MVVVIAGALIIGVTLGLLGAGGSAITVPVLVYLVGHTTKQSIAESMAIVGLISMAAAVPYARSKQIDWRSVWYFGVPGMCGAFAGAWLGAMAPAALQLVAFGGILVASAFAMLRPQLASRTDAASVTPHKPPFWKIGFEGTAVGVVTGFVGVGGGFLIVPALVILGRVPMRLAIGASLVIIALKSAVGFAKYQQHLQSQGVSIDLQTVVIFVLVGAIGSLLGKFINGQLNQGALKRAFAVFLILLGGLVMVREGTKLIPQLDALPTNVSAITDPTNRFAAPVPH